MRPVLRALSGVHPGTIFLLGERTTIGRAAVADVQLVGDAVSRFHALVERDEHGRHVISDLHSKAGTFIDGTRVQKAVLEVGNVVEICGFQLRFEHVAEEVLRRGDAPTKISGFAAVQQTRRQPLEPPPAAPLGAPPKLPLVVEPTIAAVPEQGPPWLELLRELIEYRTLREDGVGTKGPMSPLAIRFRALHARFSTAGSGSVDRPRRTSRRFACDLPVLLGTTSGADVVTLVGRLLDVGAGGAKLRLDEAPLVGSRCWLLIATGDGERGGMAFQSQVVWSDLERRAGLAFFGRPTVGPDVLPPMWTR
ncbi:MAG: FHA domain-containing protein [Nannocystaceae bacterium]|nr:FHA domain-containing protein [Nannocystaceae bacterium]